MISIYLLSLLCVGNLGKNAHSMAAIDSGRVLSVYLPHTHQTRNIIFIILIPNNNQSFWFRCSTFSDH